MHQIRKANQSDLLEIADLIEMSLPNDPLVRAISRGSSINFFWALLQKHSVYVAVDIRGHVIGCITIGNVKDAFCLFFRKLSLPKAAKLILSNLQFETIKVWSKILLFICKTRYTPSSNEISYLAVHSAYRGKRVGKALVSAAAQDLIAFDDNLVVKTLKATPENILFYKSCGMLITQEQHGRVVLKGSKEQICTALKTPKN
jgi:N-acetylglutamate synthase-like GNAT family acetyltransferase